MSAKDAPHADNLFIGKGQWFARRHLAGGTFGPWTHLGNIDEAASANEDTRLEKFSSMTAEAPLLASRLQRRKTTLTVTADEHSIFNLSLITMSEVVTSAAQAATPVVDEVLSADVPTGTLGGELGGQIFFTTKFGPMTAISLNLGATPLVLGTDYEIVHNRKGQMAVRILAGSAVVTNDTDDLTIDYTPPAYAAGLTVLRASKETTIELQLRFIGDPSSGPAMQADVWKANVSPEGGLGFISEEFGSFQIVFELLDDSTNHPDSPLWDITMTDG